MVIRQYYLSEESNLERAHNDTGLSLDEIESLVGRFNRASERWMKLKGKVVIKDGRVEIRHHFTNKLLWHEECNLSGDI